jgi:hypothetical protein
MKPASSDLNKPKTTPATIGDLESDEESIAEDIHFEDDFEIDEEEEEGIATRDLFKSPPTKFDFESEKAQASAPTPPPTHSAPPAPSASANITTSKSLPKNLSAHLPKEFDVPEEDEESATGPAAFWWMKKDAEDEIERAASVTDLANTSDGYETKKPGFPPSSSSPEPSTEAQSSLSSSLGRSISHHSVFLSNQQKNSKIGDLDNQKSKAKSVSAMDKIDVMETIAGSDSLFDSNEDGWNSDTFDVPDGGHSNGNRNAKKESTVADPLAETDERGVSPIFADKFKDLTFDDEDEQEENEDIADLLEYGSPAQEKRHRRLSVSSRDQTKLHAESIEEELHVVEKTVEALTAPKAPPGLGKLPVSPTLLPAPSSGTSSAALPSSPIVERKSLLNLPPPTITLQAGSDESIVEVSLKDRSANSSQVDLDTGSEARSDNDFEDEDVEDNEEDSVEGATMTRFASDPSMSSSLLNNSVTKPVSSGIGNQLQQNASEERTSTATSGSTLQSHQISSAPSKTIEPLPVASASSSVSTSAPPPLKPLGPLGALPGLAPLSQKPLLASSGLGPVMSALEQARALINAQKDLKRGDISTVNSSSNSSSDGDENIGGDVRKTGENRPVLPEFTTEAADDYDEDQEELDDDDIDAVLNCLDDDNNNIHKGSNDNGGFRSLLKPTSTINAISSSSLNMMAVERSVSVLGEANTALKIGETLSSKAKTVDLIPETKSDKEDDEEDEEEEGEEEDEEYQDEYIDEEIIEDDMELNEEEEDDFFDKPIPKETPSPWSTPAATPATANMNNFSPSVQSPLPVGATSPISSTTSSAPVPTATTTDSITSAPPSSKVPGLLGALPSLQPRGGLPSLTLGSGSLPPLSALSTEKPNLLNSLSTKKTFPASTFSNANASPLSSPDEFKTPVDDPKTMGMGFNYGEDDDEFNESDASLPLSDLDEDAGDLLGLDIGKVTSKPPAASGSAHSGFSALDAVRGSSIPTATATDGRSFNAAALMKELKQNNVSSEQTGANSVTSGKQELRKDMTPPANFADDDSQKQPPLKPNVNQMMNFDEYSDDFGAGDTVSDISVEGGEGLAGPTIVKPNIGNHHGEDDLIDEEEIEEEMVFSDDGLSIEIDGGDDEEDQPRGFDPDDAF